MRMRNKKTGKIQTCDMVVITDEQIDGEIASLNRHTFIFRSVEQFNDEYEDYKPEEPLIKEQEVRDVVKLWAKANLIPHNANSIEYQLADTLEGTFSEFWCNSLHIVFWSNVAPNAIHGKCYSIDELCGEEE